MAMTAPLAVIAVGFSIAWWIGLNIVGDVSGSVSVRMALNDTVSGAVHAHKEHGDHHRYAPKGSHSVAILTQSERK
jgi:hypothetical protein